MNQPFSAQKRTRTKDAKKEANKDAKKMQTKRSKNNYFLTWISAQVKEMGGFVFQNCEIHFSRVFWV